MSIGFCKKVLFIFQSGREPYPPSDRRPTSPTGTPGTESANGATRCRISEPQKFEKIQQNKKVAFNLEKVLQKLLTSKYNGGIIVM